MSKRRFVIRTIKNGQVKIFGRIFKPTDKWLEYDGRLDGQRWAFGLYWRREYLDVPGVPVHWEQSPFVALWGTEEAYIAAYEEGTWNKYCEANRFAPDMVFDSETNRWYYPWHTWHAEGAEAGEKMAECQPTISI